MSEVFKFYHFDMTVERVREMEGYHIQESVAGIAFVPSMSESHYFSLSLPFLFNRYFPFVICF